MNYPARTINIGDPDASIVKQIQNRLNKMGCGPIATDGIFGKTTTCFVKEFQSRYCDFQGNPLVIDGKVGIQT